MELVEGGLDDYLVVDDHKVVADLSKVNAEEPEASSDTEVMKVEEEPVPPVTRGEATSAIKVFQRYVNENTGDPAVLHFTDKLDDYLAQ